MALDFSRYLDVPVEDIEAPKPLPTGSYFALITKWEAREVDFKDGNNKTPVVTVTFRTTGADDDVDPDLLPEGGGQVRIVTRDYRLNDPDGAGKYALRRLGEETCQLPVRGLQLSDLLPQLISQEVKVFIEPQPSKTDPDRVFARVSKVLSIHEREEAERRRSKGRAA